MKTEYEYIYFAKLPPKPKTVVYECRSIKTTESLGVVRWYGPWRQYCFFPGKDTIFNVGCMSDVIDFIKQLPRATRRKKEEDDEYR